MPFHLGHAQNAVVVMQDEVEDLAAAELALKRQRVRAAEVAWTSVSLIP